MTGIVIGAGAESIYAIQKAQQLGNTILAFDGNEHAPGLKYADYSFVTDIKIPELIIESLGNIRPDFILPVPIGRYLTTAGIINDFYGLGGLNKKSSLICTDKLLFHNTMFEHGLRQISCVNLEQGQVFKNCNDFIYPCIAKPRYGSGSRSVMFLQDENAFYQEFLIKSPFKEDFIIESVIDGDEYGVDAAVIESRFHLVLLRKKVITPPPVRQCIAYASIKDNKSNELIHHHVKKYMIKAVEALGMNNCILHADLIIDEKFNVTAIEISGRPSGHRLHDLFTPMASGIDMIEQYIRFCNHLPYFFNPQSVKSLAIRYFDFENCKVVFQPKRCDLNEKYDIMDYQCNIGREILGSVVDGNSIMNRGYFILEGENDGDALEKCQEIIELFEVESINKHSQGGIK